MYLRFSNNIEFATLVPINKRRTEDLDRVVERDGGGEEDTLARLEAVHARVDVDCVGAEHGEHPHVQVVEGSWYR